MRLNVVEAGQGRPLVIMHGLMGSSRNWGAMIRQLGERRRVLALDLPNHGGSPWTEVMDYPFMARAVAEFIEGLGRPAAVVGHSMGGKAAMALALTRPDLVETLVVVDIAPVGYGHTFAPYIKAMRAVPLGDAAQRRADVDQHLQSAIPDPRVRAFLMQNLDGEPGAYRWRPNLAVLGAAMTDILGFPSFPKAVHYDGPTLFLAGGESDYVLPEHEPNIRALFPHARIEHVPGAGHWLHADRPDVFVEVVGEFVGA